MSNSAGYPPAPMKILVVDDEDTCRALLQDIFATELGVEVVMARDGAEAWWLLTDPEHRFNACIVDIKMPVVDGLKLVERIRATPHLRPLPVILCTGVHDRETVAQAVRLGVTQYVLKPYQPAGMREKIRAVAS